MELRKRKKLYGLWKQGRDFAGRLQNCGSLMQGEDMKGQSSVRVETGQCSFQKQEGLFEVC